MLENIRGDSYVECCRAEGELGSVGTAVRGPPTGLRSPNRKCVRLYTNDRAEGFIGLGVSSGAAPVVENAQRGGSTPGNLAHQLPEQAAAAAEPPMAQLN